MAAVGRKVGRHHIAFYRSWLLGLDLREIADRYLETGLDLRVARTTLQWVKDSIRQVSLRHGRHREARLLRLRLTHDLEGTYRALPSLEEFQEEHDPHGALRESELIRCYLEAYPEAAAPKARRRQRMIDRQIKALAWVEPLLTTSPVTDDPVQAWFDAAIACRLVSAGLTTIGLLMDCIRSRGYRWWTAVPRLGEKGATRIVSWLQGYEDALGVLPDQSLHPLRSIPAQQLVLHRDRGLAVVPLEAHSVTNDLAGSSGSNRFNGPPRIEARDDNQAILSWLASKAGSPNTARAYRKEAERMLLWAVMERGKALSDLSVEDCTAYRAWLGMLGRTEEMAWPYRLPQRQWIGRRNTPRHSNEWRPFDGPLSASSVRQALTIINGLFEWLVRVQYCAFNPWDAVGKAQLRQEAAPPEVEMTRAFSQGEWRYLIDTVQALPRDEASLRLGFVLHLAHSTGMRLSELVESQTGRIYTMPLRDQLGVRWMLKILGKGNKWRAAPLSDQVMTLLQEYLQVRGLHSAPFENAPTTPLIARIGANLPITPSALYKLLREVFQKSAATLEKSGRKQESKAFARASVHWLRHTCGSHLGAAGVPVNMIQSLLGHASLATTSIYTDADEEDLWRIVTHQERAGHAVEV